MNIQRKRMPSRLWGGLAVAVFAAVTMAQNAVAQNLKVAVMPSFGQNQTYGNAEINEPLFVWGRAWGGTAPYDYSIDFGDGSSVSGTSNDLSHYVGQDHTYTTTGSKTMTLTVEDATGAIVSRSATIRVFLNPAHDILANMAIEKGLLYLYKQRIVRGRQVYWDATRNAEYVAGTVGFATLAFEENGHKRGNDYEEDIYAELVEGALNRILVYGGGRTTHGSSSFHDHDDGTAVADGLAVRDVDYLNDNGFGAYLWAGGHETYVNGICGLALCLAHDTRAEADAAIISEGAFNGLSYLTVIEDLVEQMGFCQNDGNSRGGWIYNVRTAGGNSGRDGSSQQWPCLLLKGAIDVLDIPVADWVLDNLDLGFTALQNGNGAIGYRDRSRWNNTGKTGGALVGWSAAGKDVNYGPVQNALTYIGNQYYASGGWNPQTGWAGYMYAMYGMKKGLSLMGIETISTSQGLRKWYDDMCAWLLGLTPDATHGNINPGLRTELYAFGQRANGSWASREYFNDFSTNYSTANAILILTRGVTVPLPVAVITKFWDDDPVEGPVIKAGDPEATHVTGSASYHADPDNFQVDSWAWILRLDDGSGNPVGSLDWNNPQYVGANIRLDRDLSNNIDEGLAVGTYHLSLRVTDDADPEQFNVTTVTFSATDQNLGPEAVAIPSGQLVYNGQVVGVGSVDITLDGRESSDPEGDPIISYEWDVDGNGTYGDGADDLLIQGYVPTAEHPTGDPAQPIVRYTISNDGIGIGLRVCSEDINGVKCDVADAPVEISLSPFDLFIATAWASNIDGDAGSADVTILFASDEYALATVIPFQIFDGRPPAFGGSGTSIYSGDFIYGNDDPSEAVYTTLVEVNGLSFGAVEEVFVYLDPASQANPTGDFGEYDESEDSNVAAVNVSNQPPVALAQNVTVDANGNCLGEVTVAQVDAGSSDPDGDPITFELTPPGPYSDGQEVTLTVTDNGGLSAQATAIITVQDKISPVLAGIPADVLVECDAVPDPALPTATDNCDNNLEILFSETRIDGDSPNDYQLVRTWTVTDASNNSDSASQTITVEDSSNPVLAGIPADVLVECDAVPAPASPTATDNCDNDLEIVFSETRIDGDSPNEYQLVRTWTVTDASGNSDSASQTITVDDSQAPALVGVPADITVVCEDVPAPATPSASDNCDANPVITFAEVRIDGASVNDYLLVRTWTVTDSAGNSSSLTQTVTVQDIEAPVLIGVPADVVAECDTVPVPASPTATDNCDASPVITFSEVRIDGVSVNDYQLVRTWTVTDVSGNSSSQTQTVTVQDTTKPVITMLGLDVVLYQGDTYTDAGATALDNCAGDLTAVINAASTVDTAVIGYYTVTYTVADPSGNEADAVIRNVTVLPRFAGLNALFGCTDVKAEKDSVVNGSVGSANKVDLHQASSVTGDAVNVAGNIDLKKNAAIGGDATAGGKVTLKNGASVGGTITENAILVDIPLPVLAISTSGKNVTVKKNKTGTVAPGSYKKLSGKQNSTINLSSGHYTFQSVSVDKGSTLNLDVTNGPITVDVVGNLDFKGINMVLTGSDATDVLFQVQGSHAKLGTATVGGGSGSGSGSGSGNKNQSYIGSYVGTYLVPNGHVELANNGELTGSAYAQNLHVKQSTTVNAQPALDLLIAASVNWQGMESCQKSGGSGSSKEASGSSKEASGSSKEASGSSKEASGSSKEASGSSKEASGSSKEASGSSAEKASKSSTKNKKN